MAPHPQRLTVTRRAWALARPVTTAHGVRTTVDIVVAEIADGDSRGRGEGVPLQRYGETIDSVVAAVDAMKGAVFSGLNRETLQQRAAAWRGAQRARLRVLGHRCQARLLQRRGAGRARRGGAGHDGLHARPRYAGKDGGAGGRQPHPPAAQTAAGWRRRCRTGAGGAAGSAGVAPHRRCQRELE